MSSHGDLPETCKFGHTFIVHDHDGTEEPGDLGEKGVDIREDIAKGKIKDLEDVKDEIGGYALRPLMGDHYKNLKVSAGSQGTPYTIAWACADKFDEDLYYNVSKTHEKVHVSPQSQTHQEFRQRKREAEQNLNQTLSSLSDLRKQKHMLEHDIRKLRSRVESFESRDETLLKSDFIELVDNSGGGQQGAAPGSLDFLRNNNIYPSIVADFNEMDGVEDLEEDGKLGDLPENEKAVLKKKYTMYEKWKDLYGSEIRRKLNEIKGQLNNIERSIEETKTSLEPYARDKVMINQKSVEDIKSHLTDYFSLKGYATMFRDLEYICYRPMKKNHGSLDVIEDESEATHYRIVLIHAVHANISGGEDPRTPSGGPSSATIFYFPAIVCRHVFENFFKKKIDRQANQLDRMLDEYKGNLDTEKGDKLKEARTERDWAVRDLRKKLGEKVGKEPPLELSSTIRRVEDGIDSPDSLKNYGEDAEYYEAVEELLEIKFEEETHEEEMYGGMESKLRKFTGQTDDFVIPDENGELQDLLHELKFSYYWDFKIGMGLYVMN